MIWSGEATQKVNECDKEIRMQNDFLVRLKENILIECLQQMLLHLVMRHLEFSKRTSYHRIHHFSYPSRAKDQKDVLKYILTIKNKLSRPQVKYQVHFVFYVIFLCLLSYLALFIKPSLLQINEEMNFLMDNETCSQEDRYCPMARPSQESWSILQIIINVWVFMFALEEFRQVSKIQKESSNSKSKFFSFFLHR